jgi:hypothetical protein
LTSWFSQWSYLGGNCGCFAADAVNEKSESPKIRATMMLIADAERLNNFASIMLAGCDRSRHTIPISVIDRTLAAVFPAAGNGKGEEDVSILLPFVERAN